jgi:diguanylate cyclase (GGDEF)-like protein/PAS domain S-box-containing protein
MDSGAPRDDARSALRVLLVEDSDEDAALIERTLTGAGFTFTLRRVNSEAGFRSELVAQPDLVLSDYELPSFSGIRALELTRESCPGLPFILISGRMNRALKSQAARLGASDVLSKEHLNRLGAAVSSALKMSEVRSRAQAAERKLSREGHEFGNAFDRAAVGMALTTLDGRWLRVNQAFCEITGYTDSELRGTECHAITHADDVPGDVEVLQQLLAGKLASSQRDKRYLHKDGHAVWVQVTGSLVRGNDGAPLYRVVHVLDITHRKDAEGRFWATFDQAAVGIAHTTTEGAIREVNRKLCEMLGYRREELLELATGDLSLPEDRGTQDQVRREVIASVRPYFQGEKRYVRKNGDVIWVNRTVTLARETVSGAPYLVQVFEDVTERKRTEARLERAARARRVLAEGTHALVRAESESGLVQAMCRIIVETGGYRQGWIGLATGDAERPLVAAAHAGYGEYLPMVPAPESGHEVVHRGVASNAFASCQTVIARDLLSDTRPENAWRRARALRYGFQSSIALPLMAEKNVLGVLVMHAGEADAFDDEEIALLTTLAADISFGISTLRTRKAREDAEAALRQSEERFRVLTELSSDWSWEQDAELRFVSVSGTAESHGGIAAIDHTGKTRWELPRTYPANTTWDAHKAVLAARQPFRDLLLRRFDENGKANYVSVSGNPVFDARGEFKGYRGVAKNVTASKLAETELRKSEQRFRDIFDQAAVGISRVDLDGVLVDVNQKFCEMIRYTRDELIGKPLRAITHPDDFKEGARLRMGLVKGGARAVAGEKRFIRKDGTIMWARRTMSIARDHEGNPGYVISVVEDITERKEAEERFQATFDQAAVGIMHTSLDRRFLMVNRKFCEMVGYSREELMGMTPLQIHHPEDADKDFHLERQLLAGEIGTYTFVKRYVCKDGRVIWGKRTVSLVRESDGRPKYFIRVVEDITERRRADEELQRKTEIAQLLESLARAANEATSPEAAMRTCLERICEHGAWPVGRLGIYGPGEGDRFPEHSLWHAKDPDRYDALMRASLDARYFSVGGRFISVVLREKKPVWLGDIASATGFGRMSVAAGCGLCSAFAFPVIVGGEVAAFLEFFAPEPREPDPLLLEAVTSVGAQLARLIERSRAMAELAQLASIVECSQDAMMSTAPDGTILTWNAGAERLFGYRAQEVVGRSAGILVPEERRHEFEQGRSTVLAGGQVAPFDTERLGKGGQIVQVSISASPIRNRAGGVIGVAVVYSDVADRKRAEEAIARERALLRTIIDTLPDYIYVKDRDGRFRLGNRAWFRARGISDEEIVGKTVFDVFPREIAEKMAAQDAGIVEGGPPLLDQEQMVVVKAPDGRHSETRWFSTSKVAMRNSSGSVIGTIGISRDITERTLSERRRAVEHAVSSVLAESVMLEEAVPRLLRTIGEAMDWAYGAYWSWSETEGTLVRRDYWSDVPIEVVPGNEEAWIRLKSLKPGGLLRRAWVEKVPTWIVDVEREPTLNRRARALELGLRSAYSFPVLAGSDVLGVMEFFGRDVRQPDEMLLQLTGSIGRQIGQFIERKRAEAERARLAAIVETSDDAIVSRALDGTILSWNAGAERMLGYTAAEMIGRSISMLAPPEYAHESRRNTDALLRGEVVPAFETVRYAKDGRRIEVQISVSPVRDAAGTLVGVSAIFRDITERKRTEAALQESEEQFRQLANNIPQAFWITDIAQKKTLYLSPAARTLFGRSIEEILASPRVLIRSVHAQDRYRIHAARKAAAQGGYDETYRIVRADGTIRWIHDRAFPVRDAAGNVYRVAGIAEDITERKLAEERLMHLAHYDVLTSLPNRVLFYDRLKQALAQAKRSQWSVGVMFIDVDRFKNVNDTLGHPVGDKLLQQVSERLSGTVRSGDTVGRLGGDEFAVVLTNLAGAQDANLVAQKILASFKQPFRLEGAEVYVTASIGITIYPTDSTEQDALTRNADTAMYRAKEIGRDCYQFYMPEMNARALETLSMEGSLRRALERNEFLLHYQPKASVVRGEIVGVEALLRWRHPERGLVSPGEFMSVLEDTGLIVPVGDWVLRAVCAQIKEWEGAGMKAMPVAVNLSARQFSAREFGATISRILDEHQVDPALIELEITESSLMVNTEEAVRTLEFLKSVGVGLSIDDFGTGYSSLGYLKRFPLDSLKIDRSFVRDITTDGDDATITRAVISMAHSLGLKVIAEGVETGEQLAFLAEYGCDEIQGYFFSRPLEVQECGRWLREDRRMQRPSQAAVSNAPTILLVDDDDDALTLLRRGLTPDGYQILSARSAHEALNLLGIHRVDVIITDQSMPGMRGTEFLQRVKALHPATIRMITSAYSDFNMMADAVNKGEVARFLPKSLTEEQLRADVREALQNRSRGVPPLAA